MARRYVEVVQDDLTGEAIGDGQAETIEFAVNGESYSIDLSKENAADFHQPLEKYIAVAASPSAPSGGGRRRGGGKADTTRRSPRSANGHRRTVLRSPRAAASAAK